MRRRLVLVVTVALVVLAAAPGIGAGADTGGIAGGLAVFAADAESWAFSAEVGIPGPVGPLTSHTKAAVDNSPHAVGAAGLADPGFLVRAAGEVTFGAPAPTYCESAHPEGPPEAGCGGPAGPAGVQAGQVHTHSGDGPDATSTASYGRVTVPDPATPAVGIESQSSRAVATATTSGVEARSTVTLQGISLGGGAVRIESLELARTARADGTAAGLTTSTAVSLAGMTVAGQTVDPGRDATRALVDAARAAFGDRLQISSGELVEERTPDGKIRGETAGLVVRWQPSPDRWVRVVLGYARVLAYAVAPALPSNSETVIDASAPLTASGSPVAGSAVLPLVLPSGPIPTSGDTALVAAVGRQTATDRPAAEPTSADPSAPFAVSAGPDAPANPVGQAGTSEAAATYHPTTWRRPAVRWVSPFLVMAQMTGGSQAGWCLAGIVPLLLFRRLWRQAAAAPTSGG